MQQFGKLFLAHLKITFREKQVWFWSICYPVFLLFVFLTIFGGFSSGDDDSFEAKVALVAPQQTEQSAQLAGALTAIDVFVWENEGAPLERDEAQQLLKDKEIGAYVVLPDGAGAKQFELVFNREQQQSASTQVIAGIMQQFVMQYNMAAQGVSPEYSLSFDYVSSGSDKLRYSDFLLTGMIALAISQAGMFGMVGMVEMRRNGLLKRLMLTPVSMRLFGLGNMSVRFVLSAVQVVLLTLMGVLFYKANLDIDLLAFLIIFVVGTLAFSAIGFLIASLSKSMESYFGIVNLLSFVMMFLSGVFFDYAMLPSWLKPVADVLPLTFFVEGVRDTMVYGLGVLRGELWLNAGVLLLWTVGSFLIGSRFYSWKAEKR